MTPLRLRDDYPPNDALVVIRGGEMNSDYVLRTATRSFEEFGIWTVSVFVAESGTVEAVCRSVRALSRYGKVRLSSVGRVRAQGFALIPTLHHPHFDVVLADVEPSTLDRLELAFDLAIPNPARQR
jgi:hypothetical protein